MASSHASIRQLVSPLLQSFRTLSLSPFSTIPNVLLKPTISTSLRPFSSTSSLSVQKSVKKGRPGDPRIKLIRYHLQHPETPRPLRLSRMRALRHWTIHRAWMLMRRKKAETQELELHRMYQSMHSACEELRTMDGPGTKNAGRLYRVAMEKKGIFRHGGVPIEYARLQTDTPGREAWNHEWTR